MVSTKPYLIRAIYEWCVDQGYTPFLSVNVNEHTRVPTTHVKEGQIVLNIGVDATNQFRISNEAVEFQARFNGVPFPIYVPIDAVEAIYSRENGQGLAFPPASEGLDGGDEDVQPDIDLEGIASLFALVKEDGREIESSAIDKEVESPTKSPPQPSGGKPHLTRIK